MKVLFCLFKWAPIFSIGLGLWSPHFFCESYNAYAEVAGTTGATAQTQLSVKTGDDLKALVLQSIVTGTEIVVPAARYVVLSPISVRLVGDQKIRLKFSPGTLVEGGTPNIQLKKAILSIINHENTSLDKGSVQISGSATFRCVNCWDGFDIIDGKRTATNGGSGISISQVRTVSISDLVVEAGIDEDGIGDSGLEIMAKQIDVRNNTFRGWDDCAIYISGGLVTQTDGSDVNEWANVIRNVFRDNHVSIASKRRFRHVLAQYNNLSNSFVDFAVAPTGNNGTGKNFYALNNYIALTRRNVVDAMGDTLANTTYERQDFDQFVVKQNIICGAYYYGAAYGAALFWNRGLNKGMIITSDNLIDRRRLGANPVYKNTMASPGQGFLSQGDKLVDGCR